MIIDNELGGVLGCVDERVVGGAELDLGLLGGGGSPPAPFPPVLGVDQQTPLLFPFPALSPPVTTTSLRLDN